MSSCESCRHSRPMNLTLDLLECHRFPPSPNPNYVAMGYFPVVKKTILCGEYAEKRDA